MAKVGQQPNQDETRKSVDLEDHFEYQPLSSQRNEIRLLRILPVRKFDGLGYLVMEISLKTLEFQPAAQAARKAIARSEDSEKTVPSLHRIISAVGVDPQSQEIWIAIGTLLMRFDKDGQRLSSFRTFLPSGARLEASQILVEPGRLVIAADPQGIFEFSKPEKLPR